MGSLNINCPTNYIIMILINMFNDVLRKPLVTLLLGAENAQILSPCKESILKSCSAAWQLMALLAAAQDTGLLRYHAVIIWLLSGVKQTKEATEAALVSSGPIVSEDRDGRRDTTTTPATLCQDPRLEPRRPGAGAHDATAEGPRLP